MGPNGAGKSTLANAIMGHRNIRLRLEKYCWITKRVTYAKPEVRAQKGLFLSFQYPAEISGVTISDFLRTAANSLRGKRGWRRIQ